MFIQPVKTVYRDLVMGRLMHKNMWVAGRLHVLSLSCTYSIIFRVKQLGTQNIRDLYWDGHNFKCQNCCPKLTTSAFEQTRADSFRSFKQF